MVWTAGSSAFSFVVLSIKGLLHICCPVLTTSVVSYLIRALSEPPMQN